MTDSKKISRRRHSAALKAQILTECAQPGASVASVAMAHGINANVVHKWRRLSDGSPPPPASFVPLPLPAPVTGTPDIRIEVRRGASSITVCWPLSAAADCAAWMRELLR